MGFVGGRLDGNMIKIYGFGWVGKAMSTLFPDAIIYDPALGYMNDQKADIGIICVPTPLKDNKWDGLDCSVVEDVVKNAKEDLLIIRSTVMPGTCDYLEKKYNKNIVFSPEYLGESVNHPMTDQKTRPFIILGGRPENRRKVIELYQTVYNANTNIRQVTLKEAEVIKLCENKAIAYKRADSQEDYDACEAAGVDYYTIREAVYGDDPRFNLWWTFCFPDKRGFNSKCIPKDVYGWCAWVESCGYEPKITKALLKKNEEWIK
jgi:UDPglucose 6-dehydrogenase